MKGFLFITLLFVLFDHEFGRIFGRSFICQLYCHPVMLGSRKKAAGGGGRGPDSWLEGALVMQYGMAVHEAICNSQGYCIERTRCLPSPVS